MAEKERGFGFRLFSSSSRGECDGSEDAKARNAKYPVDGTVCYFKKEVEWCVSFCQALCRVALCSIFY